MHLENYYRASQYASHQALHVFPALSIITCTVIMFVTCSLYSFACKKSISSSVWFFTVRCVSGPGSRSSSTSSLSSIASGAPPTPTSPRRWLASEPLDGTTKTPLRDQQQANNQVNNSGTNSSSSCANKLQPLRKNVLPGKSQELLPVNESLLGLDDSGNPCGDNEVARCDGG